MNSLAPKVWTLQKDPKNKMARFSKTIPTFLITIQLSVETISLNKTA
jgi:hypothetical protein